MRRDNCQHGLRYSIYCSDPTVSTHVDFPQQKADASLESLTFIFVPSLDSAALKAKCENVFDRSQQSSALRRVLVYGMLYNLCMEYSGFYSSVPKTGRFSELAAHFINELEDALDGLPLALPASQETVEALIIGVSPPEGLRAAPLTYC